LGPSQADVIFATLAAASADAGTRALERHSRHCQRDGESSEGRKHRGPHDASTCTETAPDAGGSTGAGSNDSAGTGSSDSAATGSDGATPTGTVLMSVRQLAEAAGGEVFYDAEKQVAVVKVNGKHVEYYAKDNMVMDGRIMVDQVQTGFCG
jgi:hypothetical protein